MLAESTFYRVFQALSPKAFGACMRSWVTSLAECLAGQVVAFDGKTLRGALARAAPDAKLHLVKVWVCKQRLLLAQHAVEDTVASLEKDGWFVLAPRIDDIVTEWLDGLAAPSPRKLFT